MSVISVPSSAETLSAVQRMLQVRPQWRGLVQARRAIGLAPDIVLHAGPPLASQADICAPLLNAACAALIFEGVAKSERDARNLIRQGRVRLMPAQDFNVATPLAAVVTASMWLQEVADADAVGSAAYAALNEGTGPALRFGVLNEAVIERLRFIHHELAPALADAMRWPVDLLPIAAESLAQGDELHARAGIGSGLLLRHVDAQRLIGEQERFLCAHQYWFLNLWMAGCLCILSAAREYGKGDVLIAAGGNGQDFGIQVSSGPGVWIAAPATPPQGPSRPDVLASLSRLPAIGDSAVIDALGFGALALDAAPEHAAHFEKPVIETLADAAASMLVSEHPVLRRRIGLDVTRAGGHGLPHVCLAALDAEGRAGLVGFGISQHPAELYRRI